MGKKVYVIFKSYDSEPEFVTDDEDFAEEYRKSGNYSYVEVDFIEKNHN